MPLRFALRESKEAELTVCGDSSFSPLWAAVTLTASHRTGHKSPSNYSDVELASKEQLVIQGSAEAPHGWRPDEPNGNVTDAWTELHKKELSTYCSNFPTGSFTRSCHAADVLCFSPSGFRAVVSCHHHVLTCDQFIVALAFSGTFIRKKERKKKHGKTKMLGCCVSLLKLLATTITERAEKRQQRYVKSPIDVHIFQWDQGRSRSRRRERELRLCEEKINICFRSMCIICESTID